MSKGAESAPDTDAIVTQGRKDKLPKTQPTKVLPTNRIAIPKQIEILRAYAASSEPDRHAVTNADVGQIVKMQASTVSLANSFFTATGLLERTEGGYLPSVEVMSFFRAFSWNAEIAIRKLAPVFGRAWFAQVLMPKLRFRPMDEQEAITDLAEAATAGPEYRVQLKMLIDFLELVGIAIRDGNTLRLAPPDDLDYAANGIKRPDQQGHNKPDTEPKPAAKEALATTFTKAGDGSALHFAFSVNVDPREVSTWSPERISAFFNGIAAVLAAKGAAEVIEGSQ